eukprot:gene7844-9205_t
MYYHPDYYKYGPRCLVRMSILKIIRAILCESEADESARYLDGTLLNSDKKVSDNTKRVLQYIEKNRTDVDIVLASGRAPYLIIPTETMAEIDCAIIGYNGGVCISKKRDGRKVHFLKSIAVGQLSGIYKFVEENNLYLNVYGEGIVYGTTKNRQKADNYAMMVKLTKLFPEVGMVKSNCHGRNCKQFYVEMLCYGTNKGTSVRDYCLNIKGLSSMDSVVAFGDAENDIEMLVHAGLGICLANGTNDTKVKANGVSKYTNDQDGVARELVVLLGLPADLIQ